MKLTGPACTEALNEAEEAGRRERTDCNAGGVRVERRVRQLVNYRLKNEVTFNSVGVSKKGRPKELCGLLGKAAYQPEGS